MSVDRRGQLELSALSAGRRHKALLSHDSKTSRPPQAAPVHWNERYIEVMKLVLSASSMYEFYEHIFRTRVVFQTHQLSASIVA